MQALRMASFMHKPSLLSIQALIMIGPFLTNSGRFLDAWTLFGTTIRLAHSIGLHRHPKYLDPAPPTQRECSIRQTIWWWMLHMDQEYSMTLGRPLGISGIGDCPPPHELTTNPQMLRFGEFANHFTLLARQILSSDRLNNSKIDEFTDQLRNLLDTMPEMLQFDETWLDKNKEVPEWPLGTMAAGASCPNQVHHSHPLLTHIVFYCKTHTYLILLNRQRIGKETAQFFPPQHVSTTRAAPSSFQPSNAYPSAPDAPKPSLRGRALVLSSSQDLLTAFLFFHLRVPAAQITWTMGQQAFNSCMILLLDAMETGDLSRIEKVEKAYVVFQQLEKNGVHELASMAVERVSWGLAELGRMNREPETHVRLHPPMLSRGGVSGCDEEMQDGVGNEARQGSGVMHDTVMGNTGMLLLEDPGLQSFVPEAFAPLTWSMSRGFPGGGYPLAMQVKEEADQKQVEEVQSKKAMFRWREEVGDARSSEQRQEESGSPGSARDRFTTFSTAPSQALQPQGLTAPTSRPTSATILQEQHEDQYSARDTPTGLHEHPPHLRHHSYPLLHQIPPPTITSELRATFHGRDSQDVYAAGTGRESHIQTAKAECNWNEELEGGRLHGTMPRFASPRRSLQALPEHATASAPGHFIPFNNPNVHPSWAARPAARSSSASELTVTFSQQVNRGQAIPAYTQESAPMTTWQHRFPFHLSSTSNEPVPAPTGTQAEHFVTMDGWTWTKENGPGQQPQ
ncbi:hypothetical protein SLS60_008990 [Paraconiothyrium brasiliense]|uniref:Xylanolytic transcriptional activator regulatory domain-containing protein n=1 Tax=Paraconiothyrium brasiliense TaxID=300254 RepID=A0ABR3QW41_9PLEO